MRACRSAGQCIRLLLQPSGYRGAGRFGGRRVRVYRKLAQCHARKPMRELRFGVERGRPGWWDCWLYRVELLRGNADRGMPECGACSRLRSGRGSVRALRRQLDDRKLLQCREGDRQYRSKRWKHAKLGRWSGRREPALYELQKLLQRGGCYC